MYFQRLQASLRQQCLEQAGPRRVPWGVLTVCVGDVGSWLCPRSSALPPHAFCSQDPPEERHLGTVHGGTESQCWVVPERRHDEAEHQSQAHKEGGEYNLAEELVSCRLCPTLPCSRYGTTHSSPVPSIHTGLSC